MFARENFSALVVVCSGCGNGIASREEIYELSEAMARRIVAYDLFVVFEIEFFRV